MIIRILPLKYACGSEKGITREERPYLTLEKLNSVIEWDMSELNENHPEKELKEGDVFEFHGQMIAVDKGGSLVLYATETGPLGLGRVVDDIINHEINFFGNIDPLDIFTDQNVKVDWSQLPNGRDGLVGLEIEKLIGYQEIYSVFLEKFEKGRGFPENWAVKVSYSQDTLFPVPIEFYLTSTSIFVPSEYKDCINTIVESALKLLWRDIKRVAGVPPTVFKFGEEDEAERSEEVAGS